MKYIFSLILLIILSSCDTPLQPKIVSINGQKYVGDTLPPEPSLPKLITPFDSLRSQFNNIAKKNNYSGTVYVAFTIDTLGYTSKFEIIRGGNPKVDKDVINLVKSARFEPGTLNGRPVLIRYAMPFKFH